MLTVQILVKNNAATIEKTLTSLSGVGRIVVGDLGSTDGTPQICAKYGAEVVKTRWDGDYSKARNGLIGSGMNFYVEPWEVLASGRERLEAADKTTRVYAIQGGIVSKEIRIWKDIKFVNPVYETLVDDRAECDPSVILISVGQPDSRKEKASICKEWMAKKPTSPDPYYYMACSHLANREYKEFFSLAEQYLVMDPKAGISGILLRYNMAQVQLHTGELESAARNALSCLSVCPVFAEFWCLLGDVLYKCQRYDKARRMYENAMIIGKRRLSKDAFPVEISKYKEYPVKMIENIRKLMDGANLLGQKVS
jgi:glycosyltransferase involved in cell wall biosynthesis